MWMISTFSSGLNSSIYVPLNVHRFFLGDGGGTEDGLRSRQSKKFWSIKQFLLASTSAMGIGPALGRHPALISRPNDFVQELCPLMCIWWHAYTRVPSRLSATLRQHETRTCTRAKVIRPPKGCPKCRQSFDNRPRPCGP